MTLKTPSLLELWLQMLMMIELFFMIEMLRIQTEYRAYQYTFCFTWEVLSQSQFSTPLGLHSPPPSSPLSLLSSPSAPCWEQGKARLAYPPNITHCLVISNKKTVKNVSLVQNQVGIIDFLAWLKSRGEFFNTAALPSPWLKEPHLVF